MSGGGVGNCHVSRGQCKMEVMAKQNKKGGNNQPEVWLHEWWRGGNCHAMMWQCRLQSTGGVAAWVVVRRQREWWRGSNIIVG